MANYSTLKAAVADVVKTNGTQAITGANLQAVLLSIINSVGGGGYIFAGVATPSTDAGTPDQNVFYVGGAGTYANFGSSYTVPVGSIGVFKYNGSWTKEAVSDGLIDEVNQLEQEVNDIERPVYGNSESFTLTSAGTYPFSFHKDITYTIWNDGDSSANFSTRITESGSTIDGVFIVAAGSSVTFTASQDAYFLRMNVAATGHITTQTFLSQIQDLGTRLDGINSDISELSMNAGGLEIAGRHTDYVDLNTKAGVTYRIKNNVNVLFNAYFRDAKGSAANQESVTVPPNGTANITLQNNHAYLYFYAPSSTTTDFSAIIYKLGTLLPITISKINNTSFYVSITQQNGKVINHRFQHMIVSGTYEYGSGQSKTLTQADCWYTDDVFDASGVKIVQGNINFINNIYGGTGFEEEGYFVGEGHGCAIQVYTKFYADGKEFDPTSLTGSLSCNEYRFVEKVNYFADIGSGASGGIPYPKLTDDGDLILANTHFADAIYKADGSISLYNKLTVQRDGTIFRDCYAGMLRVYNTYFNEVILNNGENTDNTFVYNTSWTVTPINGSQIDVSQVTYEKGDNIIMVGQNALISQSIKMIDRKNSMCSYRYQFYTDSVPSFKVYQLPVIGQNNATILGETIETFQKGDIIECYIERRLELK